MIGFFVPILSLSIILIVIVIAYKPPRIWKGKITQDVKWKMMIGYIGILLFGMIVYFSFVQPNFAASEQHADVLPLHDLVYKEEQVDELPSQYIVREWTVLLEKDEMEVALGDGLDDSSIWPLIIVEKSEDRENEADIKLYETPSTINGLDISSDVKLANVHVEESKIIVSHEDEIIELHYSSIQNEMTVTQFDGENRSLLDIEFNLELGEQIIYISIPKDVTLQIDEDLFNVVY